MKYNYKSLTKKAFSSIIKAYEKDYTIAKYSLYMKKMLAKYEELTERERFAIYKDCISLYRACKKEGIKVLSVRKNFDKILSTAKKVNRKKNQRERYRATRKMLREKKTIFYLCSVHTNCAEDHKPYEGKIYVDRYWRASVLPEQQYAVKSYIKNHHIITVQDAMKEPIWLITRPNCKHFFIPVQTEEVLTGSAKSLIKKKQRTKNYTRKDYYELRNQVDDIISRAKKTTF